MPGRDTNPMPDIAFRLMSVIMALEDLLFPHIDQRVASFGIRKGMTIIDYACGPGRYSTRFSKLVGADGRVYAVDIHPLALATVRRKMDKQHLLNIVPVLAQGYDSGLPAHIADMVCALDVFFGIKDPSVFLREIRRITGPEGVLIIDDGHQSRAATLRKIKAAGGWTIAHETADHLTCTPVQDTNS